MSIIKKLSIEKYLLYFISINDINNNIYDKYINKYCNSNDIIKINFFVNKIDRLRSLGSIILQKFIVINEFHPDNYKKILIRKNDNGKPYIIYENKLFNYNVSHDEDIVMIIYYNNINIGLDILLASRKINFDINDYVCSNLNIKQQLWTLIEAYYKYIGTGLDFKKEKLIFKIKDNSINSNENIKITSKKINLLNKDYYISIIHGFI